MRRLPLLAATLLAASTAFAADAPPRAMVFFPSWSALIDQPARNSVADAAAWAKQHPDMRLIVTGYASTVGSHEANELLARLRAQVIVDELMADGVEAKRITVGSVGPTTFVFDPVESRRVEIEFAKP